MRENLDMASEWLLSKQIETDFKDKKTNTESYVKIKEKDLYKLFVDFIKLIKKY